MRRALAIAALVGIVAGGGAMRCRSCCLDVLTPSPISVQARLARQPWEYRTLNLQPNHLVI